MSRKTIPLYDHWPVGEERWRAWTFIDEDTGLHLDISGWDFFATIKESAEDADADAVARIEPADVSKIDGGGGLGTISRVLFKWTGALTASATPGVHQVSYKAMVYGTIPITFRQGSVELEVATTVRSS